MLWNHRCLKHYYGGGEILEDWKIKISVLWLFGEVAWLTAMMLVLFEPGAIEQVMAGEIYGMQIGPEWFLIVAITLLVPLVMAFLSLTLEGSMNRWANIIMGIVFTVLNLGNLIEGVRGGTAGGILLMEISAVVAPALIVWYAWKSKQKA